MGRTTVLSPVVQLWLAERPRLGVNGLCTLQGGDLSANHVRQMVKLRAAPRLYRAGWGISLSLPGQQRLSNDPYQWLNLGEESDRLALRGPLGPRNDSVGLLGRVGCWTRHWA